MQNLNKKKLQSSPGKIVPTLPERVPIAGRGEALHFAVVGAGGFASFAVQSFLKVDGIKIIGVTDIDQEAAAQMARINDAKVYADLEALLEDKTVDLVYIATPPFLHYQQSKMALAAGKHVICEKPAALKTGEAIELRSLATSRQLLYVVNLMQRYNPLYDVVSKIIREKIFGKFLHGFFENYASDEYLNADHWFWDEAKSGGIFIEHGVHFFDMFSGWLGKGKVVNALQIKRSSLHSKITDRVQATVLYKEGTVNFYHGFDQPKILDRQEMRLQFEKGEITLYGWIPVKMKLHGLLTDAQLTLLQDMIGQSLVVCHSQNAGGVKGRGRFIDINFDKEITLECGNVEEKQGRYGELLVNMLTDQWNWIKDHHHKRKIDQHNAVESLRMAEKATKKARKF